MKCFIALVFCLVGWAAAYPELEVQSEESSSGPEFLSSLVSQVREEVNEFQTSCINEPGCSWKCPQNGECHCVCGNRTGDSGEK